MVVLAEANTTTTNNNNNASNTTGGERGEDGEGGEGGETVGKERARPRWHVVPIDWRGVPIEEVS